jgi:hypothetical protein
VVSAVRQLFKSIATSAKTLFKSDPTLDGPATLIGEITTNTNTERSGVELASSY